MKDLMNKQNNLIGMFNEHSKLTFAKSTAMRYRREVERFEKYLEGPSKTLGMATSLDVRSFLSSGKQPSRYSWNMRLAALKALYTYLLQQEFVQENPAEAIERKDIPRRREVSPLALDEIFRLLEAVRIVSKPYLQSRNIALVMVLFHCGIRVQEAVSLRVEQVNFPKNLLLRVRTKGNNQLSVPLNAAVVAPLQEYLSQRNKLASNSDERALFISQQGKQLGVRSVQQLLTKAGLVSGLSSIDRPITPHLLRHSHATVLHRLGIGMQVIQDMLGHASIETTQRYVHADFAERQKASRCLADQWTAQQEALKTGQKHA